MLRNARTATGAVFILALAAACGRESTALIEPEESAQSAGTPAAALVDRAPLTRGAGATADVVAASNAEYREDDQASGGSQAASYWEDLTAGRMVIRTGNASLQVESLDAGMAAIRDAAARLDGYVANLSMQSGARQVRRASVQVKVPAHSFEDLLTAVEPLGTLEGLQVGAQDVSEEFVDIQARVVNDKRMEERLLGLLDTRAGDLGEVLTLERELARIRAQIEQREGRLRYLQERSRLSTLTLDLYEPGPLLTGTAGPGPIVRAVRQAWRNLVEIIAGMIAFTGTLVPFAFLALIGWALVRRLRPAS